MVVLNIFIKYLNKLNKIIIYKGMGDFNYEKGYYIWNF